MSRITNRTLLFAVLGSIVVIVGLQAIIFGIWGADGDPPDVVVALAFVLFWGSIIVLIAAGVLAVQRRASQRRSTDQRN